jgi:hypothetical protein
MHTQRVPEPLTDADFGVRPWLNSLCPALKSGIEGKIGCGEGRDAVGCFLE